jgi:hypothetical protein
MAVDEIRDDYRRMRDDLVKEKREVAAALRQFQVQNRQFGAATEEASDTVKLPCNEMEGIRSLHKESPGASNIRQARNRGL